MQLTNTNNKIKKICNSILKLSLKNATAWETVIVKENSQYLGRIHSGIFKYDNNSIIIVGGYVQTVLNSKDENINSKTQLNVNDQIVEYNLTNKTPKLSQFKLNKNSKFSMAHASEYGNALYLIDDDSIVHKFHKNSFEGILLNFYEAGN